MTRETLIAVCENILEGQPLPLSLFFQNNVIIYNKNSIKN